MLAVRRALLAVLLLLMTSCVPGASAEGADFRFDVEAVLVDAETQRLVLTIAEGADHHSHWTLFIPSGMSVVEARDAHGPLSFEEGPETVDVETRGSGASYAFQVVFEGPTQRHGPYVILTAQPMGFEGAISTARAILPEGWRLVGWRADGLEPDEAGVFSASGDFVAEYLALPSGVAHPAPDARVERGSERSDAQALVSADGVDVNVRLTYDTQTYGSDWAVLLPPNATFIGARSPFGELPATGDGDRVTLQTPYPTGFHLGARWFEVAFRLPAPEPVGGGFLRAGISMPMGLPSVIMSGEPGEISSPTPTRLTIELAEGVQLAGAHQPPGAPTSALSFAGEGPMLVVVTFLPPLPEGQIEFATDAYVVRAPADMEAAARLTVAEAERWLNASAGFASVTAGMPLYIEFTRAPVFPSWQGGFYRYGTNMISMRASMLDNTTDRADYGAVSLTVHESAHALMDRLLPQAHAGSFFDEGLAVLAENRLEHLMGGTTRCEGNVCYRLSDRPDPERLHTFYRSGATFPLNWSTDTASDEDRGFYYDYSGLVFHAYEARAPPGALMAALDDLVRDGLAKEPEQALEQVVGALLAHAPGLTREALLYPGREAAELSLNAFRGCMEGLVDPPYAWETISRPPYCHGFTYDLGNVTASTRIVRAAPAEIPIDEPQPEAEGEAWTPKEAPRVLLEATEEHTEAPGAEPDEAPAEYGDDAEAGAVAAAELDDVGTHDEYGDHEEYEEYEEYEEVSAAEVALVLAAVSVAMALRDARRRGQ